jgi:hypothetical protein
VPTWRVRGREEKDTVEHADPGHEQAADEL